MPGDFTKPRIWILRPLSCPSVISTKVDGEDPFTVENILLYEFLTFNLASDKEIPPNLIIPISSKNMFPSLLITLFSTFSTAPHN